MKAVLLFVLGLVAFECVTAGGIVPVNDKNWYFTELNWYQPSNNAFAQTQYPGAYFKIGFNGTSVSLLLDQAGTPQSVFATVKCIVDTLPPIYFKLPYGGDNVVIASGLKSETHSLSVYFINSNAFVDRWNTPENVFRVTGLKIDADATTSAPTLRSKRMLVYWDSIGEGVNVLGHGDDMITTNEATETWAFALAAGLDAEVSMSAFAAEGLISPGFGNTVPLFTPNNDSYSAWNKIDSQHPRMFNKTKIDYVFCGHGTNDAFGWRPDAAVTAGALGWMMSVRAVLQSQIFLTIPFGGFCRNALTAAYSAYQAKVNDPKVHLIDLGDAGASGLTWIALPNGTYVSADGVHPLMWRDGQLGAMLAVQAVLKMNGLN